MGSNILNIIIILFGAVFFRLAASAAATLCVRSCVCVCYGISASVTLLIRERETEREREGLRVRERGVITALLM